MIGGPLSPDLIAGPGGPQSQQNRVRSDRVVYVPVSGIPMLAMSCCNSLLSGQRILAFIAFAERRPWMGGVSLGLMSQDMCRML
jgi:hypothetical protein